MAWLAVSGNKAEFIYELKPLRGKCVFFPTCERNCPYPRFVKLPKGSIKKLIGRELSWNDEPIELKGE